MDLLPHLKKAVEIDSKREYWYIRTEHGNLYDAFKENNFIALGWNEITIDEIRKSIDNSDALRTRLASLSLSQEKARVKLTKEPINPDNVIDITTQKGKLKSSMIINKLQNFYNLKRGDVVVIPSAGSASFSFGVIADDKIYDDLKLSHDCLFRKRRKVNWVAHRDFDDLDAIFFTLKKSMHAISSVKFELSEHIDRVMNDLYFKDGFGHYVIRVKRKEDINASHLFGLGGDLLELLNIINERYNFQEPINETIVKINIQSEGDFVLKGKIGNSIVCLGLIISMASCTPSRYEPANDAEKEVISKIKSKIDSLEIDVNKDL